MATSLARAWQARGRAAEVCRLLGGICRWFGTGTGGPAFAEARGLPGQLRTPKSLLAKRSRAVPPHDARAAAGLHRA